MSYLGKTFVLSKTENLVELLRALELPYEVINVMTSHKKTYMLEKEGESYTLTITSLQGPMKITFTSGVEIEEDLMKTDTAKSVFTVNGNIITQEQKFPTYTINRKLEFSDSNMIETINASAWNGTVRNIFVLA